jgi:hypothetical protein
MPANDRLRIGEHERLLSIGPEPAGQDPEELIEDRQSRPPVSTLEYTELLTKCAVLD